MHTDRYPESKHKKNSDRYSNSKCIFRKVKNCKNQKFHSSLYDQQTWNEQNRQYLNEGYSDLD